MRWRGGGRGSSLEVVQLDAEGFAAVEVVDEGVIRLFGFVGVFLGEVHEVGAVREDMTEGAKISGQSLRSAPLG